MSNPSLVRQNYSLEAEAAVNRQINLEQFVSYANLGLQFYFSRDDVALPGFAKTFADTSDRRRERARKLMKYQNMRGGRVVLADIKKSEISEWGTGLDALQAVLQYEKSVNQSLLDLHDIAVRNNDAQMADYLGNEFLEEQVIEIREVAEVIANLRRVGPGLGEYQFDRLSLNPDGAR